MIRRLIRFFLWLVTAVVVVVIATVVFRRPLMRATADLWIVDEPVTKADAVVVLGGGAQNRPFAAAQLVARGVTTNVLIAQTKPNSTDKLGLTAAESDLSRAVLLKQGVPPAFIHSLGTNVNSTFDEARAVRAWAIQHRPRVIAIPTDLFHTRRVNWLMEKQLRDLRVDVRVIAVNPEEYTRTNWWKDERGIIAFQNELLKNLLYRYRY
jgi:uncharacterized SAM-binding protein YcdF (DUF218 family)